MKCWSGAIQARQPVIDNLLPPHGNVKQPLRRSIISICCSRSACRAACRRHASSCSQLACSAHPARCSCTSATSGDGDKLCICARFGGMRRSHTLQRADKRLDRGLEASCSLVLHAPLSDGLYGTLAGKLVTFGIAPFSALSTRDGPEHPPVPQPASRQRNAPGLEPVAVRREGRAGSAGRAVGITSSVNRKSRTEVRRQVPALPRSPPHAAAHSPARRAANERRLTAELASFSAGHLPLRSPSFLCSASASSLTPSTLLQLHVNLPSTPSSATIDLGIATHDGGPPCELFRQGP